MLISKDLESAVTAMSYVNFIFPFAHFSLIWGVIVCFSVVV